VCARGCGNEHAEHTCIVEPVPPTITPSTSGPTTVTPEGCKLSTVQIPYGATVPKSNTGTEWGCRGPVEGIVPINVGCRFFIDANHQCEETKCTRTGFSVKDPQCVVLSEACAKKNLFLLDETEFLAAGGGKCTTCKVKDLVQPRGATIHCYNNYTHTLPLAGKCWFYKAGQTCEETKCVEDPGKTDPKSGKKLTKWNRMNPKCVERDEQYSPIAVRGPTKYSPITVRGPTKYKAPTPVPPPVTSSTPTSSPTSSPTSTPAPTLAPTSAPSQAPTEHPSPAPTATPTGLECKKCKNGSQANGCPAVLTDCNECQGCSWDGSRCVGKATWKTHKECITAAPTANPTENPTGVVSFIWQTTATIKGLLDIHLHLCP
jgi:hypothetical protein